MIRVGVSAICLLLLAGPVRASEPKKPSPEAEAQALLERAEPETRKAATEAALEALAEATSDAEIREEARRLLDVFRGEESPPESRSRYVLADPDQGRLVYTHSAFAAHPKRFTAKAFNVGHWSLKYAINEHIEVGGQVSVPVFLVHFGPFARARVQINEWLNIGGFAQVHAIFGYDDLEEIQAVFYGGGPIVTFGTPDLSLTVTAFVHGQHLKGEEEAWSVVPVVAVGVRVHRIVKIVAEGWLPLGGVRGRLWTGVGDLGMLIYGVRLFNKKMFGDISFLWPFHEESWNFMKYMPMGIPILNFGFTI
jgi:hypothetical protein